MTCAMYKFTAAWHNMHLKWVCKCTACKAGSFHSYVYLFLCKIHKCFYPFVLLCLFKPSPNTIMLRPDFCKHLGKLKFTKHIFLPFNDSFKIIFEINHYYGEKGIPSIDSASRWPDARLSNYFQSRTGQTCSPETISSRQSKLYSSKKDHCPVIKKKWIYYFKVEKLWHPEVSFIVLSSFRKILCNNSLVGMWFQTQLA